MTQELQSFTSFIEEGFVVRYNNPKSDKHGSERNFDNEESAKKHADRGNSVDKSGGKYTVHKTNEKGHDVKEELKGDQHKLDKNKNGKLDKHDFKLLRKEEAEITEETDDEHYSKQSQKMKDAINLHLRKGKSYSQAVADAKVHVKEDVELEEEVELEESMTDSWKKVQSMDKGSVTGGKEEVRKRLAYLSAVHAHHKKYGNDTKKVKADIESLNRSRIAEGAPTDADFKAANEEVEHTDYLLEYPEDLQKMKKADSYKVGDKVFTKVGGKWHKGRVTTPLNKAGNHGVEFQHGGKTHSYVSSPEELRLHVEEVEELDEAVKTGNEGNGYHGQHPSEKADAAYSKAHAMVKKVAGEAGHLRDAKKPNQMVKHYLDSAHGRHLKGNENAEYIKKDFGKFKKSYKPEHFSEEMSDEQKAKREKIVKGMKKSYSDFVDRYGSRAKEVMYATATKKAMGENADCDYEDDKEEMKEGNAFDWKNNTNKSSGKYDVKQVGNRTIVTRKYNPDTGHSTGTDDDEKPAEKRGRGRPAGSKSGAKQKGSGKSNDYRGIPQHSLNLPK